MAITKILSKRMRLDKLIRYVQNPDKTDDAVFTYCQYCDPKDAAKQMQATKERYDKTDGIQAFHIIQSFSPGEITPELAHELGIRFIKEHLSDYEVVLGTHVDKEHIHNHITLNSVSFKNGKKYHSTAQSYYQQIRKISDRLCKEYGLSVVMETYSKGITYAEWKLHETGLLTLRELFDQDVEECLSQAMNLGNFYALMEDHGYTVRHHGSYPSFVPDGYSHPYRIKRNGKSWTENEIESFIDRAMSDPTFEVIMPKVQKAFVPYGKQRGFRALYVSWMYVLGIIGHGKRTQYPKVNYKELKRFEQYKAQAAFLDRNKIDTREQLQAKIIELNETVETLNKSRIIWNSKKKRRRELYSALSTVERLADVPDLYTQGVVGIEEDYIRYLEAEQKLDGTDLEALKTERNEVYEKVASINAEIRECQKELRLCEKIQADSPRIEQQMREQIELDEREHDYSL
ncbi:MAG: relaxase/mobilization nuclease domain-containing protein [Clostridia bacterium]|nr:relaxase/mobilization nuclease domain-containing protein [Clostridia bacterium]